MAAADQTATYAVNLVDGTSGPAESAAQALKNLKSQMEADTRALREMQAAMRNLKAGNVVAGAQFKELKDAIDAKKKSIAEAQSSYLKLGGTFGKTKLPTGQWQKFSQQVQEMPGPLGRLAGMFEKLSAAVGGGASLFAIAAVAAALVAVAVAAGVATVALLKYGIAQANAARSENLGLQALTKMRSFWGAAAGNADQMSAAIDQVSASVLFARGEIVSMNAELYKMGLRGENLTAALEGMAIKTAALGPEAGKGFAGMAAGANMAGQSVKRLAADVKARFGGIVAMQMLDLDVQMAKLKENFGNLFLGLNIEGLLKALGGVTQLFSQATYSGRALKAILTAIFQPMIRGIEYLGPLVKRFFQGMIIGALLVGIAFLKVRNAFRKMFGDDSKGWDLQNAALKAGLFAVSALIVGVGLLALVFGLLLSPLLLLIGLVVSFRAGLANIAKVATWVKGAWDSLIGSAADTIGSVVLAISSVDWTALGVSIVQGIVDGLVSMAGYLAEQVTSLGTGAMAAFKKALGISSPSKEFMRLGVSIPEGIAEGMESGAGDVEQATADIAPSPGAGGGGSGTRAGATSISFGDIIVNSEGKNGKEIAGDILNEIRNAFEGVAIQMGVAPT